MKAQSDRVCLAEGDRTTVTEAHNRSDGKSALLHSSCNEALTVSALNYSAVYFE